MSVQIANIGGVSITQYAAPKYPQGKGYQVTWGVDKHVTFDKEIHATTFMQLLLLAKEK